MIKLTSQELHHLINEHEQKDPRHALSDMERDFQFGFMEPDFAHTYYLRMIAQGQRGKWAWKRIYGIHRKAQNQDHDQDPGGCYGRYE